jgi:hypothetical protein
MGRADASSDVVLIHLDSDEDGTVVEDWENGDITRLRAAHGTHRVKVRLQFQDLQKRNVDGFNHFTRVRTDEKMFLIRLHAYRGWWAGESLLAAKRLLKCRGLKHHIDYAENTVRVSVPRSCLGRPKWVRVGAATNSFVKGTDQLRFDDALSTGTAGEVPDEPALGRKLRRC